MKNVLLELEFKDKRLRPTWLSKNPRILFKEVKEISGKALVIGRDENKREFVLVTKDKCAYNYQEQISFLLNQEYIEKKKPLLAILPFHYHHIPFRIFLNKLLVKYQSKKIKKGFPDWPSDVSVDVLTFIKEKKKRVSWPKKKKYAIILSHDIDTSQGMSLLPAILSVEEKAGLRSTNFFVGNYYKLNHVFLTKMQERGHEVACHGDKHDYLLPYLTKEEIRQRMEKCNLFLKKYDIAGFRAPSLLISESLDQVNESFFSYDSSVTDTELFMPDSNYSGSCSVFPFFKGKLLRIPITLPMDSSLLFLGYSPEKVLEVWREKLKLIKEIGGVAMLVTHSEKHFSANRRMLVLYERFIKEICSDKEVWITTGKELTQYLKGKEHDFAKISQ